MCGYTAWLRRLYHYKTEKHTKFPFLQIFGVHLHTVAIAPALRYSANVPSVNEFFPCVCENIHIDQTKSMLIRDFTLFNFVGLVQGPEATARISQIIQTPNCPTTLCLPCIIGYSSFFNTLKHNCILKSLYKFLQSLLHCITCSAW